MKTLKRHWPLLVIVLGGALLRFWQLGDVPLLPDESYYWLWSEWLAPAYYDNPAGTALVVRLSTWLAGESEVGIRWFNALLGLGGVLLVYALGLCCCSRPAALIAATLVAAGAPYLITSRFVYTDALQLVLLLLNLMLLAPLWENGAPRSSSTWRFWAVGLSMALLFNTKYNAYLYAGAILALLLAERRGLLRDRRTWLAMGIALTGALPVLAWNATHRWVSLRWQFAHFAHGAIGRLSLVGNLQHTLLYLTPPIALAALPGLLRWRGAQRRLLLLPALALVIPILFSPAGSPRNLTTGWVLLILLGADWAVRAIQQRRTLAPRPIGWCLLWIVVGVYLAVSALYGLGTVMETLAPARLPHSPAATAARLDALGWSEAATLGLDTGTPLFAIDYSIASQLWYYLQRPVYTSWGQYRLWGMPAWDELQVLSLSYIDPELVTVRLHQIFETVDGPEALSLQGEHGSRELWAWRASGRQVDMETALDRLDFLDLLQTPGETQP